MDNFCNIINSMATRFQLFIWWWIDSYSSGSGSNCIGIQPYYWQKNSLEEQNTLGIFVLKIVCISYPNQYNIQKNKHLHRNQIK